MEQILNVTEWETANFTTFTTSTEVNIPEEAQKHFFFKVGQAVNNYYAAVIIGLGLVGNTLSFLVMVQVRNFFFLFVHIWDQR